MTAGCVARIRLPLPALGVGTDSEGDPPGISSPSLALLSVSFFRRILGLLQTGPFAGVNEETAKNIRKVCRWRLSAVGF